MNSNIEEKHSYQHTEEFKIKFGKRLRDLRESKKITIEEAKDGLKVPRSTYSGWELGKRIPLSKSLSNLAEFYNTNVAYLMLQTDDPQPDKSVTNDLNEFLDIKEVVWKGKPISEEQAAKIAALIEAYLDK